MLGRLEKYMYRLAHPIIGEVWQLHRVTNDRSADVRFAPYDITPKRLESLIIEYLNKGYSFASIGDIYERLTKMTTWSRAIWASKCVVITLDDGYRDNYDVAYEIFKKYNVPFCIYVTTGYIGGEFLDRDDQPLSMTKEQLISLAQDPLCTLGAHSITHPDMRALTLEEQKREIVGSIITLEHIIDHKIEHIAIPYGNKSSAMEQIFKENGIITQVNAWGGETRMGMGVYDIPRYIVEENRIIK